ncbi:MAG: cyclic nucleotide-binding domain-containing protein [Elusimicrobiota bacterium]
MTSKEEFENLKKIPLFKDFAEDKVKEFSESFRRVSFKQNEVVFKEDSPGDSIFIIVSGEVVIEKKLDEEGKEFKQLAILMPGDFFGEMSVIGEQKRFAQARARTDLAGYELKRNEFFDFIKNSPESGILLWTEIIKTILRRLQHTSSELTMLYDLSKFIMEPHVSLNEFIAKAIDEIIIHFDGDWNFKVFMYNKFNDELELISSRQKHTKEIPESFSQLQESSGKWLDDFTYRMVFYSRGKPLGHVVFSKSFALSEQEKNELATIFNTISSIMSAAVENIENRLEAQLMEKLKTQKYTI